MNVLPLKLLIVDDEVLARKRVKALTAEHGDLLIVGECSDGADALRRIRELSPDLVFLDVEMPGLNGLSVVRELAGESVPMFVFTTAYSRHGLAAFEAHAVDFLLKPFDSSRFGMAIAKAMVRFAESTDRTPLSNPKLRPPAAAPRRFHKQMAIRSHGVIIPLKLAEVDWIEADRNYVRFHAGDKTFAKRETLSNLEQHLDPECFRRINRSVIVNLERISELRPCGGDYEVTLRGGQRLLLTPTFVQNLAEFMN